MNKRKKTIRGALAAILVIAVALFVFVAIVAYQNNKPRFTVADTLPDGGGKKVTVILLGGQSNASGTSHDEYLKLTSTPEKYAEYEAGYDNVYINYFVSGTTSSAGFVKCTTRQGERLDFYGFGPELGLAEKLHEERPDEMFFIIKYAWGGTNLFEEWLSPSSKGKTGHLYKNFTAYVRDSLRYLEEKNYDVSIEAMCWMQGESDSFSVEASENYDVHLSNFIKDIRAEFSKHAAEDGIAFVDATIAYSPMYWVYGDAVNAGKLEVVGESEMNALIDTNAEGLICSEEPADKPDIPHYDSQSEIKLGHLFAAEVIKYLK